MNPLTWKDFKAAVEAAGVLDDDTVDWIDVSLPAELHVVRDAAERTFSVSEG